MPNTETLLFSGALLQRGFWLYVWQTEEADGKISLYVGRTGDSSQPGRRNNPTIMKGGIFSLIP
jgi:hypothetical protein